jgi:PX domain
MRHSTPTNNDENTDTNLSTNGRRESDSASLSASNLHHLMFLPKDQWSPRFETTFYSVKIEGYEQLMTAPPPATRRGGQIPLPSGKSSFPAYYYKVVVYRGHHKTTVLRRYSQFKWLYDQLHKAFYSRASSSQQSTATRTASGTMQPFPSLPPGTCPWDRQDDSFAACRQDELAELLTAMLVLRPGTNACHPAVVAFLELN